LNAAAPNPIRCRRLTRWANQEHLGIIADTVKSRRKDVGSGLWLATYDRPSTLQTVEIISLHFPQFVDGSKTV
jgi:uncharacterized protein (DUF934 family)